MGDIVDITTVPKQENIFYKITCGSLRFQVNGPRNAAIGLASTCHKPEVLWLFWQSAELQNNPLRSTPRADIQYCSCVQVNPGQKDDPEDFPIPLEVTQITPVHTFEINNLYYGIDECTMASKNGVQLETVPTPNILSANEYREFWIKWHDNLLCLGRAHTENPFLILHDETIDLKYITFAVYGNDECFLLWRFELPPLQEPMRLKPVSGGIPQWVPADTQLPDGALIGGFENEILYIIRAKHLGSLTPGKFVPSHGVGYIPWGGRMHEKSELEVLCGYDCIWLPSSNGKVPAGSVEAGYSEGLDHEILYVGRAVFRDHLIPGKVQPSHHVCYITYDDKEIAMMEYEILVVPHNNLQCANQFLLYDHAIKMH